MDNQTQQEELIYTWKMMRGAYFNKFDEDMAKFSKAYKSHILYESVVKHFDKSFKEVNQIAEIEIKSILKDK